MTLRKSDAEERAEVLLKVIERGRASIRQAACLFGVAGPTMRNKISNGDVRAVLIGPRYYISLRELVRGGIALPSLPRLREKIAYHLELDPLQDEPE